MDQEEYQRRFQNIVNEATKGNSEAQYALAVLYSRQNIGQSVEWMQKSIDGGNVGAIYTLGAWYIQGTLIPADFEKGHQLLKQASDLNFSDADLMRASLAANGVGVAADWRAALDLVISSARGGYSRALSQLAFLAYMVADPGVKAEGDKLLEAAAEGHDPIAIYTYATRILAGGAPAAEIDRAKRLLAVAATGGVHPLATSHPAAKGVEAPKAPPQPSGAGENINWEIIMNALETVPVPQTPAANVLSENPYIATFPGFLSLEEADYLVAMAARHVTPSQVMDPVSGKQIEDPYRSSSDMRFWPTFQDLVIFAINNRISQATGLPMSHQEMLGVLRYEPGQQYKPHGDFLLPDMKGRNPEVDRSGQRVKTFLVYLNDDFEGGETDFVNIDLQARGGKGEGLVFHNVYPNGTPNHNTVHAGKPVTKGMKWLSTMWIREREYRVRE